MSLPRIAIVGRPNVGKSSLLNMLAKAKVSIVDPTPGVTRDRVSHIIDLEGPLKTEPHKLVEIIDTGGYGVYTAEGARYDDAGEDLQTLTADIEAQIGAAVSTADLILFVVDAQSGITTLDETVAKLLRERRLVKDEGGKQRALPVQMVANKVDANNWEPHGLEAAALGFGEPWLVSALNNYLRREFREKLFAAMPEPTPDTDAQPEMKIALVGRRNAGKSSFVNALAGENRVIVSEIAGTTRDAIDVRFEMDGRTMVAIDTAGVRKRSKFADAVEQFANMRMAQSVVRADVVLLLIDATEKISAIDKRLGSQIFESFKPCVIVVSKWDLAQGRKNRKGEMLSPDDYQKYIEKELPGLDTAPIIFTSAKEKIGIEQVVEVAFDLFEQSQLRISTGKINKILKDILASRGPSSRLGTQAKVLFATQVAVAPPTFVIVVNKPELFKGEYERYLLNRLRETTPFTEVPVRLFFRERRRADIEDLLSGRHKRDQEAKRLQEGGTPLEFTVEGIDDEFIRQVLAEEDDD